MNLFLALSCNPCYRISSILLIHIWVSFFALSHVVMPPGEPSSPLLSEIELTLCNCLYSTCLLSSALLLASSSHLEFCCVLLLFILNLPLSSLVVALFLNAIFFLASFGAIYLLCFPYVSMNISSSLRPTFGI